MNTTSLFRPFIAILVLLAIWQGVVWSGVAPEDYFPAPSTVLAAAREQIASGEITRATGMTLVRAIGGLIPATVLGLIVAVLATRYAIIGRAFAPLADLFRSLPPAAITPISIFFLGLGWKLYAFIIVFACFWPVYMNAYAGLNAVPNQQLASATVFGYSGWSRMLRVQVPAAMPEAFIGIRTASGIALIAAIVAEMLAGRNGLGFLMSDAAFSLRIPDTFVGLIAAMSCGLLMNGLVVGARRLAIGWHEDMTRANRG